MKEKVYIDSTIPSYYFDQRESLATFVEITRRWWSQMAGEYELFVSKRGKPMIYSEILEEKYRFQAKRAAESTSIRDYMERSHRAAQELAKEYGFEIKYANLPGTKLAMDKEAIEKAIEEAGR